jgi:hypothetical protein
LSKGRRLVAASLFGLFAGSGCWEQVDRHWFDQMKNGPAVQTLARKPFDPPEGTIRPAMSGGSPRCRDADVRPRGARPEEPDSDFGRVDRARQARVRDLLPVSRRRRQAAQTPDHPVTVKLAPPAPRRSALVATLSQH